MKHELPPLPYEYDALEPHISQRTLTFHHDKHHATYVKKTNKLIAGTPYAELELPELIQKAHADGKQEIFDNAAQAWNHSFLWESMSPKGGGAPPDGPVAEALNRDFGGFKDFRKRFLEAGGKHFGSGWLWLVLERGKLEVTATKDAELPQLFGQQPLFTCDLWEHAFYLDYQNEKAAYLEAFVDHLVDWNTVVTRMALQGEGSQQGARIYRDEQERFAASGEVAGKARQAAAALDGREGAELEKARRSTARGRRAS